MIEQAGDGQFDPAAWGASHETILSPGEAIVFPPGFIHETYNVYEEEGGAEGGAECAASITFQWEGPLAAKYLRSHMPRLLLMGSMDVCAEHW